MRISLVIIFITISFIIKGQQNPLLFNHFHYRELDKTIQQSDNLIHTSFKPYISEQFVEKLNIDSILYSEIDTSRSWFHRKLFMEDLILIDDDDFKLRANLLLNFELGQDTSLSYRPGINSRGVNVYGVIGNKVSFYSSFYENQGYFRDHIKQFVSANTVVPGFGRARSYNEYGFDYSNASGWVSYSPWKVLNLQIGHGKHFIGEGYRSLLLSDNAFYYPYLKAMLHTNKFQYVSLHSTFQEVHPYDNNILIHSRKSASINYLNFIVNKHLQLGIFEGVIWQSTDSLNNKNRSPNQYNPIIGFRSLQYSLDNKHNTLLGFNIKISPFDQVQFYGQLLLDNFGKGYTDNKSGFQTGFKLFEPFKIKNLYIQSEYNKVNPYTYSHEISTQSYTYFNQALAHPLGANFNETTGIIFYQFKNFFVEMKYTVAKVGSDSDSINHGQNIFLSDIIELPSGEEALFLQGEETTITNDRLCIGYIFNRRTNMNIYFGVDQRNLSNSQTNQNSLYLFFGFRTQLYNSTFDF